VCCLCEKKKTISVNQNKSSNHPHNTRQKCRRVLFCLSFIETDMVTSVMSFMLPPPSKDYLIKCSRMWAVHVSQRSFFPKSIFLSPLMKYF
jgi:hypothetical protein